ncbi:MAG TPA: NAD-dependent epimerase/dehydratase family protein [Candidatus Aenigmarchaeota archaeon]|nr:NAD-dependent epimerase/dehydratase family protein [Candidatus Aenigmarchaeota archaeon]
MRVLVTGGAGFIGSYLSKTLAEKNEVFIFDNLSTGTIENLSNNIAFIKGDLRNLKDLEKIPNVDIVFHLAAQVSVPYSISNPKEDAEINIIGTINLLEWCKKEKVKKVIYISSAAVYGEPIYLPIDEKHPTNPISPYGISKLAAEKYVLLCQTSIVLRLANVYGKGGVKEGEAGVIHIFADNLKENKSLKIFGDGTQGRDFIHIKDVINACLLTLNYNGRKRIFNIGSGKETIINQLVELFRKYKPDLEVDYLEKRKGDTYKSYFDISRAKNELKFRPKIELEDGIKELLEVL